jgi:hypothetical protein
LRRLSLALTAAFRLSKQEGENVMEDNSVHRDKPWRPGDYPPPGPSWDEADPSEEFKPQGVPNGED